MLNHYCRRKAKIITYSLGVSVALYAQHSKCIFYLITLSAVASQGTLILFYHYLINDTVFGKRVTEYKICVLIFCKTYASNISHS